MIFTRSGIRYDVDFIPTPNVTLFQNPREDSFTRHDAVSGLVVNGTFIMAFFPDLSDFNQDGRSQSNPGSQRQRFPVNAGGGNILSEITKGDIKPLCFYALDTFRREEAYLSMPFSGMGVSFKTMILGYKGFIYRRFASTLFFAYGD
jgi:hypothetical protein